MSDKISNYIHLQLKDYFTKGEIRVFTQLILEKICGSSNLKRDNCKFNDLSESEKQKIDSIVKRLIKHEPIQYILGETVFYGLTFKVNGSVLIPRPETEELVEWILQEEKEKNLSILDVGTGSGCIAVTLAKKMEFAKVDAWDISEEALQTANKNAKLNNVSVSYFNRDILNESLTINKKYDIIVSNPPYIIEEEKKIMARNVLDFEPHKALFVDDSNPLLFYEHIAALAKRTLNKGGRLYFEINQEKGEEIVQMLSRRGFEEVELKKDISNNDRMIRALVG